MAIIIKAGSATKTGQAVCTQTFNLSDMSAQASDYLDQVRGQAAKILARAEAEAGRLRKEAAQQGLTDAAQVAERLMQERFDREIETLLPALRQAIQEVQQAKQEWLRHWEQSAVSVAVAMAERVIRRELSSTPEVSLELISEALQLASGNGAVKLFLNPSDLKSLGSQVERLISELSTLATTQVLADQKVTPGGCRVETEFGTIDHQVETQLERITEELT